MISTLPGGSWFLDAHLPQIILLGSGFVRIRHPHKLKYALGACPTINPPKKMGGGRRGERLLLLWFSGSCLCPFLFQPLTLQCTLKKRRPCFKFHQLQGKTKAGPVGVCCRSCARVKAPRPYLRPIVNPNSTSNPSNTTYIYKGLNS